VVDVVEGSVGLVLVDVGRGGRRVAIVDAQP
jgi:hypothetical protein